MQTQADLLGRPVEVADIAEVSALGAAHLGWSELDNQIPPAAATRSFVPAMAEPERRRSRELWGCGNPRPATSRWARMNLYSVQEVHIPSVGYPGMAAVPSPTGRCG